MSTLGNRSESICLQCNRLTTDCVSDTQFPWCCCFTCSGCSPPNSWKECVTCIDNSKFVKNPQWNLKGKGGRRALLRHNRKCHGVANQSLLSDSYLLDDVGCGTADTASNGGQEDDAVLSPQMPVQETGVFAASSNPTVLFDPHIDFTYGRMESSRFFGYNKIGKGPASVVAYSCFSNAADLKDITKGDIELQFTAAEVYSHLTPRLHSQFANLVRLISEQKKEEGRVIERICWEEKAAGAISPSESSNEVRKKFYTQIPETVGGLRKRYGAHSKFGLLRNLPYPNVSKVGDHAVITIVDAIADLLGHSLFVEPISGEYFGDVRYLSESKLAKEIFASAVLRDGEPIELVLHLVEWQDDFEPNYSIKGNRGSVWVKVVTISPPSIAMHSGTNTYVIACGPKESSHEEVEKLFKAELASLKSGAPIAIFDARKGCPVTIHAEVIASLQDQPERRAATNCSGGGGTYSGRMGYGVNFSALVKCLPACPSCLERMLDEATRSVYKTFNCEDCVNWCADKDSEKLEFPAPEKYPEALLLNATTQSLRPKIIDFKSLLDAVEVAHKGKVEKKWTDDTVRDFLRVECVNASVADEVLAHSNAFLTKQAWSDVQSQIDDPEGYAAFLSDYNDNSLLYDAPFSPPAFWTRGIRLSQHIETVMHLIFLGVIKTVLLWVTEWLKRRSDHAKFIKLVCGSSNDGSEVSNSGRSSSVSQSSHLVSRNDNIGLLNYVARLNLAWCKVLPYSRGQFGGWVSENYLGFARLIRWFFSVLPHVSPDKLYREPTSPQGRWTSSQNTAWLTVRNLDTKGMSTADLEGEVAKLMLGQKKEGAPLPQPIGGSVDLVGKVLTASAVMTAWIMSSVTSDMVLYEVDLHIQVFLTVVNQWDHTLRKTKQQRPRKKKKKKEGTGLAIPVVNTTEDAVESLSDQALQLSDMTSRKPMWVASYNFISLLNLVSAMDDIGPFRNVWEGGGMGEGLLRYLKPLLIGLTTNWPSNLLTRFLQVKAIGFIRWQREQEEEKGEMATLFDQHDDSSTDTLESDAEDPLPTSNISTPMAGVGRNKLFVAYDSYAAVARAFKNNVPMSIVVLSDGVVGCALRHSVKNRLGLVQLNRDIDKQAIGISGMWYHHWSLASAGDTDDDSGTTFLPAAMIGQGLFLPKLSKLGLPVRGESLHVFTVITSGWKEIGRDGNLIHAKLPLPGLSSNNNPL